MATTEVAPETAEAPRAPASTAPAKNRRNWKAWRARVVVLLMIAGAVFGANRLIQERTTQLARFDLGTVTLTAQAIPVETSQSGQVSAVLVTPQQQVVRGQQVGTMVVTSTTAAGKEKRKAVALVAPSNGIISGQPTPVGGIVAPGQPFVSMYDPTDLTLDAVVKVEDLQDLSPGMTATLRTAGLQRSVLAEVTRVVPTVSDVSDGSGTLPVGQNKMQVVLTPEHVSSVARLVPGLHFTGTVDTRTGTSGDGLHVTR